MHESLNKCYAIYKAVIGTKIQPKEILFDSNVQTSANFIFNIKLISNSNLSIKENLFVTFSALYLTYNNLYQVIKVIKKYFGIIEKVTINKFWQKIERM